MHLIRNIDRDPYKARVASKVLELAQELEIATVVEGVETPGQWQWAADHGARVINLSLGGGQAPGVEQAIQYALKQEVGDS